MNKRLIAAIIGCAFLLAMAGGCTWLHFLEDDEQILGVIIPEPGYPPIQARIEATGVDGGQFIFQVEGKTYEQTDPVLEITIEELPATITVTWEDQTVEATIGLVNLSPWVGRLMLNGIDNLWTLHPKERYVVTFPRAYDPEGGPVRLIDATVEYGPYGQLAVFCPPYTGAFPWDGKVEDIRIEQAYNQWIKGN